MTNKVHILLVFLLALSRYGIAQPGHLHEIGVKDSVFSNTLGEQRVIWVEFPKSYIPGSQQKYPVVYVLDGGVHLQAVSVVLDYYWGGFMPEMIVVGISNNVNRTRDLTTSEIDTRQGSAYNQETGGAEMFSLFLEKELIPHIEENYPATDYRTLIGHSYAGLFTINMLVHHSNLFDNYVAIDPSLDWDTQKLLTESKEILSKKSFQGKSLFLSLGGQLHMQNSNVNIGNVMEDTSEYTLFARSNLEFSQAVMNNEKNGLNYRWTFYENDLHGTLSLPSILDGLIFLFNWYPIEQPERFNRQDTPKDELVRIIRNREKKLKDHFGYFVPPFDEELLTMLGYMNLDWGEIEKSLAFFQLAVEYYPKSSNTYDSLADYYVSQDDFVNALTNVTRAYELSGDDFYKNRMEELKAMQNE